MRRLASWCVRRRRRVVLLWLAALIGFSVISQVVGTSYTNSFTLPHTESTDAIALLQAVSPKVSGDVEQIVFQSNNGALVTSPEVQSRIEAMLQEIEKVPHVSNVISPYGPEGSGHINAAKKVAFATVTFDELAQNLPTKVAKQFVRTAQQADSDEVTVAVSGQLAEQANQASLGGSGFGIILAGIVLFFVFGSLFAMALPLISALASLGTAIAIIGLLSHLMKMPIFSSELVLLIGLGVGVDYALFIVTRHRQGLLAGRDVGSSIVTALDTSGRAVLFAGIIVCIALLGMFALGVTFLYGLAVAAALGVAFTMLASLTLLPAMLGFIGPKVLSRRERRRLVAEGPQPSELAREGFWFRWASFVQRRPVVPAVVALALIALLIAPFFSLRLGSSDQGNDPVGTTTRQAYDMLADGFGPGFNGPLQLVAQGSAAEMQRVLPHLADAVAAEPDVASVAPAKVIPVAGGRQVALVNVYPETAPQAAATTDLIKHLRSSTLPAVLAGSGVTVDVGGTTAIFVDFTDVLSAKLPLFIGIVVLLSFLLLAMVFRSLVIPLTAAVMNVLSIGAAFGILVAVFQNGFLGGLFGVNRAGPIESFLPVMLFAIVFGLSMDYEVFLVTRIHEEWLKSGDNGVAVRNGLAATGKTITAAALIMILIFGSFILGGERVIKEFGLGLAGGVLVDAVVIRMAVVPAVMQLLGRWNWWFPSWAEWLPRFSVDPSAEIDTEAGDGEVRAPEPVRL